MRKHNLQKIPPGFRPVLWSEVSEHAEVFIQGEQGGIPHAYGPHLIHDIENRQLYNINKRQNFTHRDDVLLYREGPLLVLTFNDGTFTGCYGDVPIELCIVHHNMEGTPSKGGAQSRPRGFDHLPQEHVDTVDAVLPPDWPSFYGKWRIEKAAQPAALPTPAMEEDFELRIENRMAANALATQLMRDQKIFRLQPLGPDTFVFTISREVLAHIRQHMEELTGGTDRVTQ